MDVLHPLSAGLIRGIHIDSRHQFTESIRGEFFNMNVLVRVLDELFNILDLLFLYFNFLLDGENFLFQLLLFGIVCGFWQGVSYSGAHPVFVLPLIF